MGTAAREAGGSGAPLGRAGCLAGCRSEPGGNLIASVEHGELVFAVDGYPAESGNPPIAGTSKDGGASLYAEVDHSRRCGLTKFRQSFCGVASLMVGEHADTWGNAARVGREFR